MASKLSLPLKLKRFVQKFLSLCPVPSYTLLSGSPARRQRDPGVQGRQPLGVLHLDPQAAPVLPNLEILKGKKILQGKKIGNISL